MRLGPEPDVGGEGEGEGDGEGEGEGECDGRRPCPDPLTQCDSRSRSCVPVPCGQDATICDALPTQGYRDDCWVPACDGRVCVWTDDWDQDGADCESDCDDRDPARFPGADEACDGFDADCDDHDVPVGDLVANNPCLVADDLACTPRCCETAAPEPVMRWGRWMCGAPSGAVFGTCVPWHAEETDCTNGRDDDGDLRIDRLDPDCLDGLAAPSCDLAGAPIVVDEGTILGGTLSTRDTSQSPCDDSGADLVFPVDMTTLGTDQEVACMRVTATFPLSFVTVRDGCALADEQICSRAPDGVSCGLWRADFYVDSEAAFLWIDGFPTDGSLGPTGQFFVRFSRFVDGRCLLVDIDPEPL